MFAFGVFLFSLFFRFASVGASQTVNVKDIILWLHCIARYMHQVVPSKKAPYSKKKKKNLKTHHPDPAREQCTSRSSRQATSWKSHSKGSMTWRKRRQRCR